MEVLSMKDSWYIFSHGKLCRHKNTLCFVSSEGDRTLLPVEDTKDVYCYGNITINSSLLGLLSSKGIVLHFFSYYGRYLGSWFPIDNTISGDTLVRQVEVYSDFDKRLAIAKELVIAAVYNIHRNLRYYEERLENQQIELTEPDIVQKEIENASSINELMGIEGSYRKIYYSNWERILGNKHTFSKRVRRPPDNLVNAMISFLNSMLYAKVNDSIFKTRLNPTLSFLHEPGKNRYSLALDIAEIYKPVIVDRLIFRMLNRGQITNDDTKTYKNGVYLKRDAMKKVATEFRNSLDIKIDFEKLGRLASYGEIIDEECTALQIALEMDKNYRPFRLNW